MSGSWLVFWLVNSAASYPAAPAELLATFREYYGPTMNAFAAADADGRTEDLQREGALFMRCEFSESWTFEGGGGPTFAAMMHPGAERLVLFHVIASGRCWVALPGGECYWASAGEVIVPPYGDEFTMGGVEATTPVHIASIVPMPPWTAMPVVRYGDGGDLTDVVCGCLYSEDALFDPGRAAFPPVFVVRPADGPARSWFDASIAYALEESSGKTPTRRSTKAPRVAHHRGTPNASRDSPRGGARLDRWPTRSPARSRDGRDPRSSGTTMDG